MAAFKWVPGKGFVSEFEFTPLSLSLTKAKASGKYKPKPRTVYELTDPAFHPGA